MINLISVGLSKVSMAYVQDLETIKRQFCQFILHEVSTYHSFRRQNPTASHNEFDIFLFRYCQKKIVCKKKPFFQPHFFHLYVV